MIFTPVIVSHHKFMVIPFVYADKALYAWDFSTNALRSTDSSANSSAKWIFNFFLKSSHAYRLRQQLLSFENVNYSNCERGHKVSTKTRAMLYDRNEVSKDTIVNSTREFYNMRMFEEHNQQMFHQFTVSEHLFRFPLHKPLVFWSKKYILGKLSSRTPLKVEDSSKEDSPMSALTVH